MSDVTSRLSAALGDRYRIERELGAGGMATVYLAEDLKHHRPVAVKVLRPELASALGPERFLREIEITARLAHPHILPLLDSGEADGFLFYIMPYVEGESLRDRLHREKQLPMADALQFAREVADGLAYAHRHDVLHRDIKPENVLIQAGHAVIADFGIARAIRAAGGDRLTETGLAVGSPAYMSPEQAAGERDLDARSDQYALACLLYEMLGGQPPFRGETAEALVRQHLTVAPPPVSQFRPVVGPDVTSAIDRALAKTPADRFATVQAFAGALTHHHTYEPPRWQHPVGVAGLFGVVAAVLLGLTYLVMIQAGLPDWIFVGAVALLVVGLPIVMTTGHLERRRAIAAATGEGHATPGQGIRRVFTWRRVLPGGGVAFAALGIATAAYMGMRLLGIGPLGTLVAAGVLDDQATIVLADFADNTEASWPGPAVTETLRIDFAQSEVVALIPTANLSSALARMRRAPDTPLDEPTAREIAVREGIPAVLAGEITPAGSGYVLTARLIEPEGGNLLAAARATAADDTEFISAIERLSRDLRERIGESYGALRSQQPLDRVTTTSLEALRRYSTGIARERAGDLGRAIAFYREAVELDSTFAMAYRKLSVVLQNSRSSRSDVVEAARKAFDLRDRLPDLERDRLVVYYYTVVETDRERAIAEARAALERHPADPTILTTLALNLNAQRQFEEAANLARRARAYGSSAFGQEITGLLGQGRFAAAESVMTDFVTALPDNPLVHNIRAGLAAAQGDYVAADEALEDLLGASPRLVGAAIERSYLAQVRGKLREADDHLHQFIRLNAERGVPDAALEGAVRRAWIQAHYLGDTAAATRTVTEALDEFPLSSMQPMDRPYPALVEYHASVGATTRARELLDEARAVVPEGYLVAVFGRRVSFRTAAGALALAEERYADAAVEFRSVYETGVLECGSCGLYRLAMSYDRAGQVDSALAVWERAIATHTWSNYVAEADGLATAYRRLGEIYDERGDRERAAAYYNAFVELWLDADSVLQPQVDDVRRRVARLVSDSG